MQKLSGKSIWSWMVTAAVAGGIVFMGVTYAQDQQGGQTGSQQSLSDEKESTGANAGAPSDTKGQKGSPQAGQDKAHKNQQNDKNKQGDNAANGTKVAGGDAAVFGHIVVLNENEIAASSLAQQKQISDKGKKLADMIHKDHTDNLDKTQQLASDIEVKPMEDEHAKKMREQGKAELDKIKNFDGEEFEKAFIDMMVRGHQHGLDMIDNICMPTAENAQLKAHLRVTRAAVAKHLEHCEKAQQGGDHGDHGDNADAAGDAKMKNKQGNRGGNESGGDGDNRNTGQSRDQQGETEAPTGANEAARGGTGGGQAPGANIREDAQSGNDDN